MINHAQDLGPVTVGQDISKDSAGNWPTALRFGTGGGDAVVMTPSGATVTLKNLVNGEMLQCSVRQVVSVTATVADIVAVYEH